MDDETNRQYLRVAAAQVDVVLADLDANADKHLTWIGRAREEGIELLVFPELSLTGYRVGERGYQLAISASDPILKRLAAEAPEMTVVVGFLEEGAAAQLYCSAAVLHGGEVVFVHRKLNLANYGAMEEAKFFAGGRYVETFEHLAPFRTAILLCADTWNPALVHLAALHGATQLIIPTNSSNDADSGDFTKPGTWDVVLRFYAVIYGLPIVFANRIGSEGGHVFWGGSRVLSPTGDVLARASGETEELVSATLDYEHVRLARFRLPTVRDSNLALIHREIDRLARHLGVPEQFRRS